MMRRALVLAVLVVAGCMPRVAVVSFDNQARTFKVCGNRWATEQEFAARAKQVCVNSAPEQLACGYESAGAQTTYNQYTGYMTTPISQPCCAYHCPRTEASDAR